jgi:hypothetical protein
MQVTPFTTLVAVILQEPTATHVTAPVFASMVATLVSLLEYVTAF